MSEAAQNEELKNVLLVRGKFAGHRMKVGPNQHVINFQNENGPQLAIVKDHMDVQRAVQEHTAKLEGERGPVNLKDLDNPYLILPCVITLPTLNDVMEFHIAVPPGTKMSDAFMDLIAAYGMLCRPEDNKEGNPLWTAINNEAIVCSAAQQVLEAYDQLTLDHDLPPVVRAFLEQLAAEED